MSAMVLEAAQNMIFVPKSKLVDFMHLKSQGCRSCFSVYFVWMISVHLLSISFVAWWTHLHHWNMNCNGYKQIPQFLLYQIELTLQRKHSVLYEITIHTWEECDFEQDSALRRSKLGNSWSFKDTASRIPASTPCCWEPGMKLSLKHSIVQIEYRACTATVFSHVVLLARLETTWQKCWPCIELFKMGEKVGLQ